MIASGQEFRQHVNNFQSVISEIGYMEGMGGGERGETKMLSLQVVEALLYFRC